MRARAVAGVLLVAIVGVGAGAVTGARAEDPVVPATVTQTVTRTVQARYQARGIRWWARHAAQARRDANARGRTVARLKRANRMRLELGPDGLTRAFLCIHSFEGSWTDPDPPYWGGVQADRDFMRTYGGPFYRAWGTADHWPPFIQIAVAEAAYLSGRGFHPWPMTARSCGLL